jgi:hypothetical protein
MRIQLFNWSRIQELEIQLAEKQMKEMKASIEHKKEIISQSKERLE